MNDEEKSAAYNAMLEDGIAPNDASDAIIRMMGLGDGAARAYVSGEVRWVEDAQGRMRPFPTPWRPNDWTPDESPSP